MDRNAFKQQLADILSNSMKMTGWTKVETVLLGDLNGKVVVEKSKRVQKGQFYARRTDSGEVFQVANTYAGLTFDDNLLVDMPVKVGQPPGLEGLSIMMPDPMLIGEWFGGVLPSQYRLKIADITTLPRFQFMRANNVDDTTLDLGVTQFHYRLGNTLHIIPAQNLGSLSSYVPTTSGKSVWCLIEFDGINEEMVVTAGTEYDTASLPTMPGGVPTALTSENHIVLAAVKLTTGQTTLDLHTHIVPLQDLVHPNSSVSSTDSGGGGDTGDITASVGFHVEGRLAAESSGWTVSPSDQSNASGLVYFRRENGKRITLYDGIQWREYEIPSTPISITLSAAGMYDIFAYYDGSTLVLEAVIWTDTSNRATALVVMNDNIYVKAASAGTRRYLGSVYAWDDGGNITISDTQGSDDTGFKRHVWNYYNRAERVMYLRTATSSWSLTDNAVIDWTGSAIEGTYVVGLRNDVVRFSALGAYKYAGANTGNVYILFDRNGTDQWTPTGNTKAFQAPASFNGNTALVSFAHAQWEDGTGEGLQTITLREYFNSTIGTPGTDTITSYGTFTDGSATLKTGAWGVILA